MRVTRRFIWLLCAVIATAILASCGRLPTETVGYAGAAGAVQMEHDHGFGR